MKEPDQHTSPIKSPKQLIIIVVLAFVVPILLIVLLTQIVTGVRHGADDSEARILSRIQAVGTVALADANAPKGNLSGDAVYGQVCKACHEAGLAGAPKLGDKGAWSPRLAQGQAIVVGHAVSGFQGKAGVMPAKGGNPDLTEAEVGRAVVYMASQAGATWKEPAPAPATVAATSPAPGASPTPAAPATTTAKSDGKKVFDTACTACHGAGIAGAPKYGDKAAWAPRLAEGPGTLYTHALQGFQGKSGVMPPKGGYASLSDADVKAAVDYMVAAAK